MVILRLVRCKYQLAGQNRRGCGLLARAGGNPLYAEQFAQMRGEHSGSGDLHLPESIQGIVGARIDALALPEKQLLQNAAVIGKVFWPGAVEALGDRDDRLPIEDRLHALELKLHLTDPVWQLYLRCR